MVVNISLDTCAHWRAVLTKAQCDAAPFPNTVESVLRIPDSRTHPDLFSECPLFLLCAPAHSQ